MKKVASVFSDDIEVNIKYPEMRTWPKRFTGSESF